ncbi:hypothetical protein [Companilactobacillus ginsenosidimutans]|uniref:Uncharacterized protein n=1 Tax=Companilactobacillus ginsenosidimutans TaxID=1007676 RepID=A0A0H4QHB7_9LACO|nr:hypothetical protein [Companilactobacillus ginsenosidimutans]AKP67809.1 hypothetical protein ABM34_09880 [Companilactobacillus ginsenosidimutans]
MATEKKNGIFDASFEQSRNLVTDKFINDEVLKNYRKPNRFNKMLGMLFTPLFIAFFTWILSGNRDSVKIFVPNTPFDKVQSLGNIICYFLLVFAVIIIIGTLILGFKMRIFMMFFNMVFIPEFIFLALGLIGLTFTLFSGLEWGAIVPILYILFTAIFLAIFLYNKHQNTRQVLYQAKNFHRVANDLTKQLAQYAGPILLIIMVIKWIFSFINSSGDFVVQAQRLAYAIGLPLFAVGGTYFIFSYGFYNMFLSYYYLNKYRKEYDLESYLEDDESVESETEE